MYSLKIRCKKNCILLDISKVMTREYFNYYICTINEQQFSVHIKRIDIPLSLIKQRYSCRYYYYISRIPFQRKFFEKLLAFDRPRRGLSLNRSIEMR